MATMTVQASKPCLPGPRDCVLSPCHGPGIFFSLHTLERQLLQWVWRMHLLSQSHPRVPACSLIVKRLLIFAPFRSILSPHPQTCSSAQRLYAVHASGTSHCWVGSGESQGFSGASNKFHPLSGCSHEILNLATGETHEKQA